MWQDGEEEEGQGKDEAGLSPQGLRGEGGQVTEESLVRSVTSPRRHSAGGCTDGRDEGDEDGSRGSDVTEVDDVMSEGEEL